MNQKFLLPLFSLVLIFGSTQVAYGGGSGSEESDVFSSIKIISKCN